MVDVRARTGNATVVERERRLRELPLEEAGAVLDAMDRFGTVGVTVIDRY